MARTGGTNMGKPEDGLHPLSANAGWTAERVELIEKLWRDGKSAGEISRRLPGTTRNSVLGKLNRLGLLNNRGAPSMPARIARAAPTRVNNRHAGGRKPKLVIAGNNAVMQVPEAPPPRTEIPAAGPLPGTEPRPWLTREFGECAFIVQGAGADAFSCCAPADGKAYCARHHAIMYQPTPKKRPRTEFAARQGATVDGYSFRRRRAA